VSATEHRDLRSGASLWDSRPQARPPSASIESDARTDVLIVGAGITGAITAHALAAAGFDVIIADRRGPALGSTAASTALLQYEVDVPLTELTQEIGPDRAERAWRRSHRAVADLVARARSLKIDADITPRTTLYLQGDRLGAEQLELECDARARAGFQVEFLTRRQTDDRFGIPRAAIRSHANATADPVRLTSGFLQGAIHHGARLAYPLEIIKVDPAPQQVLAHTPSGTIRAKHLVFATGYELAHGIPREGHRIISTWAMATDPQPRNLWPDEPLIWEASDPYLYIRTGPQGEVICGGEDEDFADDDARDRLIPRKTETLRRKLRAMLPKLDTTPRFAWAGNFGASDTGLPTIGPVPGTPGCFAILGFGGNGFTFSMMAADLVLGALTGHPDDDADLFAFNRSPAKR